MQGPVAVCREHDHCPLGHNSLTLGAARSSPGKGLLKTQGRGNHSETANPARGPRKFRPLRAGNATHQADGDSFVSGSRDFGLAAMPVMASACPGTRAGGRPGRGRPALATPGRVCPVDPARLPALPVGLPAGLRQPRMPRPRRHVPRLRPGRLQSAYGLTQAAAAGRAGTGRDRGRLRRPARRRATWPSTASTTTSPPAPPPRLPADRQPEREVQAAAQGQHRLGRRGVPGPGHGLGVLPAVPPAPGGVQRPHQRQPGPGRERRSRRAPVRVQQLERHRVAGQASQPLLQPPRRRDRVRRRRLRLRHRLPGRPAVRHRRRRDHAGHRASGGRPWTETAWGSTDPAASGGTGSGCSR